MTPRETQPFAGRSILLAMTEDAGFLDEFRRNLEDLGFKVSTVTPRPGKFRYPSLGHRLLATVRRLFGDRTYKRTLIARFHAEEPGRLIAAAGRTDYALVIRPDLFSHAHLAAIQRQAGRCYGYQWDGFGRFPGLEERIPYFRIFYAFDPRDARPGAGVRFLQNFWFDHLADEPAVRHEPVDAYYIGSYDGRLPVLLSLAERLRRHGQSLRMILAGPVPGPRLPAPGVSFPRDGLSYAQNLDHVRSARILLDVPHLDIHQGFSFRVFEALGAGKKLITTNPRILGSDFYHPDNIHLLTDDDAALARFLAAPAVPVDPAVRLRHGFSAWIRRVLEEEPAA